MQHQLKRSYPTRMHRGGQVYYLHNECKHSKARRRIRELIPEAPRRYCRPRPNARKRAGTSNVDFYHKRANVLVLLYHHRNWLDIPNATTPFIIERPTKFGLAFSYINYEAGVAVGLITKLMPKTYLHQMIAGHRAIAENASGRPSPLAGHPCGPGFTLAPMT